MASAHDYSFISPVSGILIACESLAPLRKSTTSETLNSQTYAARIIASRSSSAVGNLLSIDEKCDAVNRTQQFWSKRGFDLTPDESREVINAMAGFITLLDSWDRNTGR